MPIEIAGEKFLTIPEILGEIGVSRQTLWRWRHEGKIPPGHRFRNGQVVFGGDDVESIRRYATSVEPVVVPTSRQMSLFNRTNGGGYHGSEK